MSDRPDYLKRYVAAMFRARYINDLKYKLYAELWRDVDSDNELLSELHNIEEMLPQCKENILAMQEKLAKLDPEQYDVRDLERNIALETRELKEFEQRHTVLLASVGELRPETTRIYAAASALSAKQDESQKVAEISKLKKELSAKEADLEKLRASKRRRTDDE